MTIEIAAPPLPASATPQMVAMNEALWAWVNAGSFQVKVALMNARRDDEIDLVNASIADLALAWSDLVESLL